MGAQSQSYVGIAFEMTIIKSSGRDCEVYCHSIA